MMNQSQVNQLCKDNELAFFRADVCLGSPQSFSLEEKAKICADMEATNKAIEDVIRADFETMPPQFQARLLDMLCASGCMTPEWWKRNAIWKNARLPRRSHRPRIMIRASESASMGRFRFCWLSCFCFDTHQHSITLFRLLFMVYLGYTEGYRHAYRSRGT